MLDAAPGALLTYGPVALALVLFAGCLGVPLPVTIMLLAAGALIREGLFDATLISPLVLVAVVGDCASYLMGRYGGWLFRKRLEGTPYWSRAEHALQLCGPAAILLTRFLLTPLATPTNHIAGGKRYAFQKFLLLCLIGDTLKITLFVGLGYLFAESWEALGASINSLIWWLILGALATLVLYAAYGRWRRCATPAERTTGARKRRDY